MSFVTCKLGDVCLVRRGTTITQKQAIDGDIPVVAGGLKPTYFHNVANRFNSTITVSGSGANAGYVNFWKQPIFASDCSTLEANDSKINILYIYYFLLGKQDYIYEKLRSGAAQPHVYGKDIAEIDIQIPPLLIQQKIVAKLDAIFAEIEKATAAAEANVKNAEALFQSYLTEVFERGGKGWKETNLKDIAEYFNGLTYSPKSVSEEGTVVLRSSNVQSDKILLKDIVRVNSPIKEKLYVTSGDILMCSRNGSQRLVGKTATIGNLDERMTFGTFMMIIRSESNFFIEWFFKSDLFKRQIASGENTMINQITRYMLDDIVIPLPDIPTQKSISSKISKLYNTSQQLKLSYTKKIKELGLYRQSILKQAFNGELVEE